MSGEVLEARAKPEWPGPEMLAHLMGSRWSLQRRGGP